MKKPRTTVASIIVRQAVERAAATSNVIDLGMPKSALTRIDRGINPDTGKEFIHPMYVNCHGQSERYDLSFLLDFPKLASPLAVGFGQWAIGKAKGTRMEMVNALRRGLFSFLRLHDYVDLTLESFDEQTFTAFVGWLNTKGITPHSRSNALGVVKQLLVGLEQFPEWRDVARRVAQAIPKNPWPGFGRSGAPHQRLDRDHLAAIVVAAEREILAIADRWADGQALLIAGRAQLLTGNRDYMDLATCLAAIDARYPGVIPDRTEIWASDRYLADAINYKHTHHTIGGYFYPSSRDLVPFVLLLSYATAFNPDTILGLTWDCISHVDRLGIPAIRIQGRKARAMDDPIVTLDASAGEKTGMRLLFDLLKQMTVRIRPLVSPDHTNRLFVFLSRGKKLPRTFGSAASSNLADKMWSYSLSRFIIANNVAPFSLVQIRTTIQDEVHQLTGDILAARAIGQQKNARTVWSHYTSDGTKKLYEERIGQILILGDRWRETYGVIDPRMRTVKHDKGAATPGFLCLDPYASPRPNQTSGRLCNAYGECPSCPLAAVDSNDVATVAFLHALRRAIYASRGRVSSESWLNRWVPILDDLESLRSVLPEEVSKAAEKLYLNLPPVG
jgi:hypothetical protein